MVVANLNFTGTFSPPSSSAVLLNFGASLGPPPDPAQISMSMLVPAPTWSSSLLYESNVVRLVGSAHIFRWQPTLGGVFSLSGGWGYATINRQYTGLPWGLPQGLSIPTNSIYSLFAQDREESQVPWQGARFTSIDALKELFIDLDHAHVAPDSLWQVATQLRKNQKFSFVQLVNVKAHHHFVWQVSDTLGLLESFLAGKAQYLSSHSLIPWEEGIHLPMGIEEPPEVAPPPSPYAPSYALNFICKHLLGNPLGVLLNFGKHPCPDTGVEIAVRRRYFIVNTITLKRVSDNVPIEILGASVGIDKSSWAWAFSGSIPYTELEKVEPSLSGPVEIELEINTIKWRFIVEEYDESKQFAKTSISIRGRALTAYLDSPYAPTRSFVQDSQVTSRQFAEAELTRPGLITGFEFDWAFPDELGWDMPLGTWGYSNLTPMEVINTIVQGAGGYVNSHQSSKTLVVRPDYPAPFWEWGARVPNLVIPKTIIRSQTLHWMEKPLYNGVYVTGENTGVTALIRKTGTIGDFQAPSFTGPMISSDVAARLKGLSILSSGGKQSLVGLELPMEQSIGLLTPGMLIEVTSGGYGSEPAWRGLIRSTSIEARRTAQSLTVSQSIGLERHYGGF